MIYAAPTCGAGCQKPWEKWCRGCNLVFCDSHIARDQHNCANRDQRPAAAAKPERKAKKSPAPATEAAKPDGPDLFGKKPTNGVASAPSTH